MDGIPNAPPRATVAFFALIVAGCTGTISDGGGFEPPISEGPNGPIAELPSGCEVGDIVALKPRRLTRLELVHTIDDLFGVDLDASALPNDLPVGGFLSNRESGIAATSVPPHFQAMSSIAAAVAARLAEDLGCTFDDAACVTRFLDEWLPVLYHRAPSMDERQRLAAFIERSVRDEGVEDGMEMTALAVLSSPQFNYVFDLAPGDPGAVRSADDALLLARWSLALWQSLPNIELHRRAAEVGLDTEGGRRLVIEWMLDQEEAARGLGQFAVEWLRVASLSDNDGEWAPGTATAALAEVRRIVTEGYAEGGRFSDLMTTRDAIVGEELAEIYGVPAGDVVTQLGPERAGLLTRAAVLGQFSHSRDIRRGLLVRDALLCDRPPPPPQDLDVDTLQEVERMEPGSECVGCHQYVDPIGYAFDAFGPSGAFDADYLPAATPHVHSSGRVQESDAIVGAVADAAELGERLGASDHANQCYAETLLRYATRGEGSTWQSCLAENILETLGPNATLAEVFTALLASEDYRAVGRAGE